LRSLAVRDILYHQIHKSVEQKEFTTHVYVPIKDFFVILNISLCFPFREGNLNECCKIVTYVVVETLWGVVWTSFESSIEIFLLYLCDQKVSPTQVEKKTNQIAAAASSILAIYIFDIVKVLGNSLWLSHILFMATAKRTWRFLQRHTHRHFYCSTFLEATLCQSQIVINQS